MNIRNIALEDIIGILEEKKPLHMVLLNSQKGIEDKKDRAFAARLVRGCVERAYSLDHIINSISSVPVKKQKPVIRNILRSGIYQILFMDSVTDFAACDEAVKLAGKRGFRSLSGFVNGILRNICRKKEEILKELENTEKKNMSFKYSMPEWIVDEFCSLYGEEAAGQAFGYFLKENAVSVRVNTSKISLESFEERMDRNGSASKKKNNDETGLGSIENSRIKIEKNAYIDKCYSISGAGSLEDSREFREGLFTVQDMSSALVGYICEKLPDSYVTDNGNGDKGSTTVYRIKALDLCAAPGGKSLYLADLGAEVTSCDISEQKVSLIRENATRCGFDNITLTINDASVYNKSFDGAFDIVLCDLPCSGLGIIGKKPDIKYNISKEKVKELAELQRSILEKAVKYVKPGGFLIFSTCTVTKEENTANVKYITDELGLKGIDISSMLPEGIDPTEKENCYIQILPGEYGSDGFFISVFSRR